MVIDFRQETLISLAEAAKYIPRGKRKRLHASTVYRWTTNGVRGVVLESIQCGGTRYTSLEALDRFFKRLSQPASPQPIVGPSLRQAEQELEAAGI